MIINLTNNIPGILFNNKRAFKGKSLLIKKLKESQIKIPLKAIEIQSSSKKINVNLAYNEIIKIITK
jgi:hypothetical protein